MMDTWWSFIWHVELLVSDRSYKRIISQTPYLYISLYLIDKIQSNSISTLNVHQVFIKKWGGF
jgi:hypothetical protein